MRKIDIQMTHSQEQELDESEEAELDANIEDVPPNCYLRCPRSVLERVAPTKSDPKKVPDRLIDKRRIMARRMMDGYGWSAIESKMARKVSGSFGMPYWLYSRFQCRIQPGLTHPITGKTIRSLTRNCA